MISMNRIHPVLVIALGFLIVASGCSSSDGDGGSGGTGGSGEETLRIMVTNDDGVKAEGIDRIVEALRQNPNNEIIVSAPAENQSGRGDLRRETPPPLVGEESTTLSGYPATAVDGYPADSVVWGLENLYPDEPPHVVLSGINEGQNVGNVAGALSQLSGTVGAAKTAACLGVPALASSQGDPAEGGEYNYDAGVVEVLDWLEANRAALLEGSVSLENITSINIPTCNAGSIRGRVEVPLGTVKPDYIEGLLDEQDCESERDDPQDDLEAFFNGFVPITPVPSNSSNTCDKLEG
jgi:5'-nucleotidase